MGDASGHEMRWQQILQIAAALFAVAIIGALIAMFASWQNGAFSPQAPQTLTVEQKVQVLSTLNVSSSTGPSESAKLKILDALNGAR